MSTTDVTSARLSPTRRSLSVRRVSRGNVLNSVLHGLLDFTLLTGTAITAGQTFYAGTMLPVLVYPLLAIILLIKRCAIEPAVSLG
ncbi:hypothetical protein ABZ412_21445 [Nocardia sp. NPDC005746]|uniref:hypothetical protein n=1 Tax=Nocardia sp. NPDC005746 TaxID=3157062 RepID=UPI0033C45F7D